MSADVAAVDLIAIAVRDDRTEKVAPNRAIFDSSGCLRRIAPYFARVSD